MLLNKSYSEELLGKRKRQSFIRTNSDTEIKEYKKKKISTEIEIFYDKIMGIQIVNTIRIFVFFGDNNYYLTLKKLNDCFDNKKEIKYFLNNVNRFGFEFLGIDKKRTKLFFKKKNDDYLQRVINNSISTKNNNFIFNFNFLKHIFSWSYVYNIINSCRFFKIIKYDKYLGIILFTLV